MNRELVIGIVDVMVQIAAILIVLWCVVSIFSALKSRYLFFSGKKVRRIDEPVGYWIAIVSWVVVMAVFAALFIRGFGG